MEGPLIVEPVEWKEIHLQHLAWLLSAYEINLVIDAGANLGQFALSLRSIGYAGRIISFEPVACIAKKLDRLASSDPGWTAIPYALGSHDSIASMNVSPGTGSSMLTPSEYGMNTFVDLRSWDIEAVPVRRLDSAVSHLVPITNEVRMFLKMDTQGYDLEVFSGARAIMPQIVALQSELPVLEIYENMPSMAEALAVYRHSGFHVTGAFPVTIEAQTGRVLEFDCVLARPEMVKRYHQTLPKIDP
jgi:FkbM family methyltransferase